MSSLKILKKCLKIWELRKESHAHLQTTQEQQKTHIHFQKVVKNACKDSYRLVGKTARGFALTRYQF